MRIKIFLYAAMVAVAMGAGACGGDDAADDGSGEICGGLRGGACAANEYCDYQTEECGRADGGGFCKERPTVCPDNHAPVLGSDGEVYANACEAHAAGADDCGEAAEL